MSVWLVRHGATEWSETGRHTGQSDVPLTPEGEEAARTLSGRLAEQEFAQVLTSPLRRARDTAELAGFTDAVVDDDLVEWNYGDYEGVTTPEIRESVPGWTVWTHPCPGGESADDVAVRLDRVATRLRATDGDSLVFGHGHALRAWPPGGWASPSRSDGSCASTRRRTRFSATSESSRLSSAGTSPPEPCTGAR